MLSHLYSPDVLAEAERARRRKKVDDARDNGLLIHRETQVPMPRAYRVRGVCWHTALEECLWRERHSSILDFRSIQQLSPMSASSHSHHVPLM
jgi:hypothetical protein